MKRIVVGLMVPLVFLVGACGEPVEGNTSEFSTDNGDKSDIPDGEHYIRHTDVDGTDCIIFRDSDMGGLTCDWDSDLSTTNLPEEYDGLG